MAFKSTAVVAGLVLSLLSGAAHASILNFKYYTDIAGKGAAISASGTIDVQNVVGNIYKIVNAAGVVNGSEITGVDNDTPAALFADGSGSVSGTNNVSMWLETLSGIKYDFGFGIASSSSGDVSFGRFVVSSVPLPGSAPLFGGALLGLGGLGYAARRKKIAA